uniref:Gypsy retrotransposon integrase-like protein 1 n=1 Tax=Esox lucius TaxID=8010 RepID=A0AAY5L9X8_ESOLU
MVYHTGLGEWILAGTDAPTGQGKDSIYHAAHLDHLDQVFEKLWRHGLKLRPDKCKLFQSQVKFLGHVVDRHGVRPDPEKISAVVDWATPSTVKEVRAFLGLAGYYRRFISGFAKIARPLNSLLAGIPADKKTGSVGVNWTEECQQAFQQLKTSLTQAPVLAYADFSLPFTVYTDASNRGLGAVLAQLQDGRERVIAYASRSVHPTEQNDANYSSFKLELLALKWAITEKFRDYLTGTKFTVFTDNNPVAHIRTAKLGAVEQRWVAQLASFDFEVKYRPGRENVNADALSRFLTTSRPLVDAASRPPIRVNTTIATMDLQEEDMSPSVNQDWRVAQLGDPDLQTIRRYVETKKLPGGPERRAMPLKVKRLLQQKKKLVLRAGILCRRVTDVNTHELRFQILCPATRCQEVWKKHHEATAHAGVERTLTHLRQHFFWPCMEEEVRGFHSGCVTCSLHKDRTEPRAPLNPIPVSYPLEIIALDFLSLSRPNDTYQNILVMIDMFTRYAWAVPTRDQTAK